MVNHTAMNSAVMEVHPVLTPERMEKRQNGRRMKEDGEPMFTLTSQDRHGVFVCEKVQQNEETMLRVRMVQNRGMTKHTLVMVSALHILRVIPEGEGLEKAVPRH